MSLVSKSKRLAIQLRANEESYITGQLDLNETLDETERLWNEVQTKSGDNKMTPNEVLPDSDLMKLQTGLAKRSARFYKPDALVFNPTEFSIKLKQFYNNSPSTSQQNGTQISAAAEELLWCELGNVAKKLFNTVPSFNFIYGTFDPDPVEVVKKKRKVKERDKIGDLTKPISTNLNENTDNKDLMIKEAERVLGILQNILKKTEENVICFYEFVTDPSSFVRTVENIFVVSLLVSEGCVRILKDRNGLPCLTSLSERERKERNPTGNKQCILSISMEEWKDIISRFNITRPLIKPRKSAVPR